VSERDVDDYLAGLDPEGRATLEAVRRSILAALPDAEQGLSYGVPVFKIGGKAVAGLNAAKHHLSYLPHSGSVLATLTADVAVYATSKGAVQFPRGTPLPDGLVAKLVRARLGELGLGEP
jgi:uncharacterized protein YdhG (YjbR/CyaY superfamily)